MNKSNESKYYFLGFQPSHGIQNLYLELNLFKLSTKFDKETFPLEPEPTGREGNNCKTVQN
jgi:hypothetical protein